MGVTIKDVAKKSGVSVTTVSLVLNKRKNRISEQTKKVIEDAALELNYIPNKSAQSLVTKKTQTIGLVVPEYSYYYCTDLIYSVQTACQNAGYFTILSLTDSDSDNVFNILNNLISKDVDGIIFDPSMLVIDNQVTNFLALIKNASFPIVCLSYLGSQLPANSIIPFHRQGAYLATKNLLNLNHKCIACVTGNQIYNLSAEFVAGYQDALEEAKIPYQEKLVFESSFNPRSEEKCDLEGLIKNGVTSIIAASDLIAVKLIKKAVSSGIHVPEDLSICGYGNSAFSCNFLPELTTVNLHLDRIARKAVNLICKANKKTCNITPEIIPPILISRDSTIILNYT